MAFLNELPAELLDIILCNIDDPTDVLSLAKSCRRLYAAAVPDHLPWRRISACEHDTSLFSLLASNKHVARGVRSMVVNEPCEPAKLTSTSSAHSHSPCSPLHLKGYRPVIPAKSESPADLSLLTPLLRRAAKNCEKLEELRLDVHDLEPWKVFFTAMRDRGEGMILEHVEVVEQPGRCSGRWLTLRT
ncbi:hypothetical protein CALVIDRAFT_285940 [Calocera viscosa TUFC12733]|uniref:F-box domain-containing protein n=1 Tax=Calocera viscosa (strain TUFC12733) TaxID=1330018 RepID=A0A167IV57_CALVF|nr:hypothetical protein CALVIDRAFT_285940 [Calocera viscosa TUFC12733]